jgi:hypothetical protein
VSSVLQFHHGKFITAPASATPLVDGHIHGTTCRSTQPSIFTVGKDFGERFSVSLHALSVANRRVELYNSQTFGGFHWNAPREIMSSFAIDSTASGETVASESGHTGPAISTFDDD